MEFVLMRAKNFGILQIIVVSLIAGLSLSLFLIPSSAKNSNKTQQKSFDLSSNLTWNLDAINVQGAWEITNGSSNITIAVIDSGIDFSLSHFNGSQWNNPLEIANNSIDDDGNGYVDDINGWDYVFEDNEPYNDGRNHWHGSYVASFVKAVAPNVSILDLRILDRYNSFNGSFWPQIVRAIDYSVNMSADIIQMSIWNYGISPLTFQIALKEALEKGVIIVGIAGNTWDDPNTPGILYPGRFNEVIATSSISSSLRASYFSRRGPENEICAPGSNLPNIGGLSGSGTSFAAPHISGCIALMKTVNQSLTPENIRTILRDTSSDLGTPGKDDIYGYGLVNVTNAVRGAAGMPTWNLTKESSSTTETTHTSQSTQTSRSTQTAPSTQSTSTAYTSDLFILEALFIFSLFFTGKKRIK